MRGSLPLSALGCIAAFGVFVSCPPVSAGEKADLARLESELLEKDGSDRTAEVIAALRDSSPAESQGFTYASLFQMACSQADSQMLPALIDIFEKTPGGYQKTLMFEALAMAWLNLHTPDTLAKPVQTRPPAEPVFTQKENTISFQQNEDRYWRLMCDLLRDDHVTESVKLVDRFAWGGWCGTGSEEFGIPQAYARVICDVLEKRWGDMADEVLAQAGNLDPALSARLLAAVLADPYEAVRTWAGYVRAREDETFYWEERYQSLLAISICLADERRLDFLESLLEQVRGKTSVFKAIGKFIPTAKRNSVGWGIPDEWPSHGLHLVQSIPTTASEQKRAMELLNREAFSELRVKDATELAWILAQKQRRESIPALRQLLNHPSETVAKQAAEGLVAMGEKAEIPEKLGDVRCVITLNGKPLSVWSVRRIVTAEKSQNASSAPTSEDGILLLPRDWFLEPGEPVKRIVLTNVESPSLITPRFVVEVTPPAADSREPIPVNIEAEALALRLVLPRPMEEYHGREMAVTLRSARAAELPVYSGRDVISLPVTDRVEFPALAPGAYQIELRIPGSATWKGEFVAGEKEVQEISLSRGSDVHFALQPIEAWQLGVVLPQLWRDGREFPAEFDYAAKTFRGVPPGAYTFRIPSSAELQKSQGADSFDGPLFSGAERSFEIKSDSPIEIDLGEIPLAALPAKQEKKKPSRE